MPNASFFACVAIVGALLAIPGRVEAADAAAKFAIKGAGNAPCSVYVEARTRRLVNRIALFEGWVHGYLTAYNRLNQATYDIVPWEGNRLILGALESYCKKNADQRFAIAVTGLINTLYPDRITEQSDMVELKSGDRTILIYREVVFRLQRALVDLKLYKGKPDGRFGQDTRNAVEAFQKSRNLPTTGLPDQMTLLALLPSSAPAESKPAAPGRSPRSQPSR